MHGALKSKVKEEQYVLDQRFSDAALCRDVIIPHVVQDGRIHRCGTITKPHGKDGVYQLFADGAGGWFQNWADGGGIEFWWARGNKELSAAERYERQRLLREARADAELDREREYAEAATKAHGLLARTPVADRDHPYLLAKGVLPHGVHLGTYGELIVPIYDINKNVQSVQRIFPDGNKLFLSGGRTAGGMFWLGDVEHSESILLGEGFATCASLYEDTGFPTVAAFSASNLKTVARALRKRFPHAKIIVCADDDAETEERIGRNPGVMAAEMAARQVGGGLAVPVFSDAAGKDFNDLSSLEGSAVVRNIINTAVNKLIPPCVISRGNDKEKILVDDLAELHVIGAALRRNDVIDDIVEWVHPKHFVNAERRLIFERIIALHEEGKLADAMMLEREFPECKGLIAQSVLLLLTAKQLEALARRIKELADLRELAAIARDVENCAYTKTMTPGEITAAAEQRLIALQEGHDVGHRITSLADSIEGVISEANDAHMRGGKQPGLTTGFKAIDRVVGGIERDQLILIGGRPSHGKTALGLNMAMAQAREGCPVAFISLETGERRLSRRILAAAAGVDLQVIRRGKCDFDPHDLRWEHTMHKLMDAQADLQKLPFHIIEPRVLTPSNLRPLVKKLVRTYGIGALYIDYIQLMSADDPRHGARESVASISKALRSTITEFNIPIFGLAQLNRGIESRSQEEQFPRLSDFKESGQLEQDADIVLFPQRRIKWLEQRGPDLSGEAAHKPSVADERKATFELELLLAANEATIVLAKNKDGETGIKFPMKFDGPTMRFFDPTEH